MHEVVGVLNNEFLTRKTSFKSRLVESLFLFFIIIVCVCDGRMPFLNDFLIGCMFHFPLPFTFCCNCFLLLLFQIRVGHGQRAENDGIITLMDDGNHIEQNVGVKEEGEEEEPTDHCI